MSHDDFEIAAALRNQVSHTDEELELLIRVTDCLVRYFRTRKEAIITDSLQHELNTYEQYKEARRHK